MANLKIDKNFGMPDSMLSLATKIGGGGSGNELQPPNHVDADIYDASTVSARAMQARNLLSPTLCTLLSHMGEHSKDSAEFNFLVDRSTGSLTTPAVMSTKHAYSEPSSNAKSSLVYTDTTIGFTRLSPQDAKTAVVQYAQHSNSLAKIGESTEMHHLLALRQGAELRSVLTMMWLLHLDVVAGAELRVQCQIEDLRRGLPVGNIDEECEYAKHLDGVRVHINSLDEVGRALLIAACDRSTMSGASTRCARYEWPHSPLVLYGGQLGVNIDTRLRSGQATVRAIINFAEKFSTQEVCSKALATALWLYGNSITTSKTEVKLARPSLHEGIHMSDARMGCVWYCHELSSQDLVSLSLFVSEALNQTCGMCVRAVIHSLNERDVSGLDRVVRGTHELRMRLAGAMLGNSMVEKFSSYIDVGGCLVRNVRQLWNTTGIGHSLLMGFQVKGTLLHEATQVLHVPNHAEVMTSDNPQHAKEAKHKAATLYMVSELLRNCGEDLNQGVDALSSDIPHNAPISTDTMVHMSCAVRLVLLGVRGSHTIEKLTKRGYAIEPSALQVQLPDTKTVDSNQVVDSLRQEAPQEPTATDVATALLVAQGPKASTRVRAGKGLAKDRSQRLPVSTAVDQVHSNCKTSFSTLLDHRWGPQITSGEGLLCGARALRGSLRSQSNVVGELANMSEDQMAEALRNVLAPDADPQTIGNMNDYMRQTDNNFTADQMNGVAQQLGLRLGVVARNKEGGRVAYALPGDGDAVLWVDNDSGGHWSSVGDSAKPYIGPSG